MQIATAKPSLPFDIKLAHMRANAAAAITKTRCSQTQRTILHSTFNDHQCYEEEQIPRLGNDDLGNPYRSRPHGRARFPPSRSRPAKPTRRQSTHERLGRRFRPFLRTGGLGE